MPMQLRRQLHPPGRALGQWAGIASVSPGCKPMHVLQIRNNHERKTHKPEAHQCNDFKTPFIMPFTAQQNSQPREAA